MARPDLRLLVMSATLGGGLGERVAALMARAHGEQTPTVPLVTSEGRSFPVRHVFLGEVGCTAGTQQLEQLFAGGPCTPGPGFMHPSWWAVGILGDRGQVAQDAHANGCLVTGSHASPCTPGF